MSISVLVVEDQEDIRDQVCGLLTDHGYVVHAAKDSDEALEFLRRLPRPCILLWDAMTPRQSLTMLDQATMEGVHVASLPVSARSGSSDGPSPTIVKRLTNVEAILKIVEEHCAHSKTPKGSMR